MSRRPRGSLTFSVFLPIALAAMSQRATADESARVLPVQYEELTAPELVEAVKHAGRTVVLPLGILEKHGPHLPLGSDLIEAREIALRATREEYAIVFPPYYFGQIFEAKHQPGAIAYSSRLIWDALQETCDELARNGIRKIILVSGHGGNEHFLPFFAQAQLERRRNYAVYLFQPADDREADRRIGALRKTTTDGHAGEAETSELLVERPELTHVDRARQQNGEDQNRLGHLRDVYTGVWWYARFPHHYAGDGAAASHELGQALIARQTDALVRVIRAVKKDDTVLKLQERFFDESAKPLETEQ